MYMWLYTVCERWEAAGKVGLSGLGDPCCVPCHYNDWGRFLPLKMWPGVALGSANSAWSSPLHLACLWLCWGMEGWKGGKSLGPVHLTAWQADTHIMHVGVSTCALHHPTYTSAHSMHALIHTCTALHTLSHWHTHSNNFIYTHAYTHELLRLSLFSHTHSHQVCELNICLMQRWRGGQSVWLWAESPCGLPQPSPLACVTGPTHAASPLPPLLSSPSSLCLPPGLGINRWVMPAVLPWGACGGAQKPCFPL